MKKITIEFVLATDSKGTPVYKEVFVNASAKAEVAVDVLKILYDDSYTVYWMKFNCKCP